jgi:hypothetical protein
MPPKRRPQGGKRRPFKVNELGKSFGVKAVDGISFVARGDPLALIGCGAGRSPPSALVNLKAVAGGSRLDPVARRLVGQAARIWRMEATAIRDLRRFTVVGTDSLASHDHRLFRPGAADHKREALTLLDGSA